MYSFFRKERNFLFLTRFKLTDNRWVLKGDDVFSSHIKCLEYKLALQHDSRSIKFKYCYTPSNQLVLQKPNGSTSNPRTEIEILELLKEKKKEVLVQAILDLFQQHAKCSAKSPLISGCRTIDYLRQSTTFPGRILEIQTNRVPLENPYTSGPEQEVFLIGKVALRDCEKIIYHGGVDDNLKVLKDKNECIWQR